MTREEILKEFEASGALLQGHFILSSGLHSPSYLQCAKLLMYPDRAEKLCLALIQKISEDIIKNIDVVIAPAMGGIIVGYELARQLNKPFLFLEREKTRFCFRRGFELTSNQKVFLVEDVITTGLSFRECLLISESYGAEILGGACLIDRSLGKTDFDIPFYPLIRMSIPTYSSDILPPGLAKIPPVKPGSRGLF